MEYKGFKIYKVQILRELVDLGSNEHIFSH